MSRIAVIGAGWAGLAAASTLRDAGHQVTVFEASHEAGGRARRVPTNTENSGFSTPLDNGQHLLLGAYDQTLALMQRLGLDPQKLFFRSPLSLASLDGGFRLRAPRWPAPLHVAAALLSARGLSARDKFAAISLMQRLRAQDWKTVPGQTVAALWADTHQSSAVITKLWLPLCLAALNTEPEDACAQIFATVLRDSLTRRGSDSDLLIPRTDLSSLWPIVAAQRCVVQYGHAVRTVIPGPRGLHVDGDFYDAGVLAVPPVAAARLLSPLPDARPLIGMLEAFRYRPIATLALRLAAPLRLPEPMMMMFDDPAQGHDGQWIFDRGFLLGLDPAHGELTIVVSTADRLARRPREEAVRLLVEQFQQQWRQHSQSHPALPAVIAAELITEKRATFAAVPSLARPTNATQWKTLVLAGDWTDTGYPSTLEGAVRSGLAAARVLMETPAP